jgi:hypothetical protein
VGFVLGVGKAVALMIRILDVTLELRRWANGPCGNWKLGTEFT